MPLADQADSDRSSNHPESLRDALGIGAGSKVEFERKQDTIVVRKIRNGPTRSRRRV